MSFIDAKCESSAIDFFSDGQCNSLFLVNTLIRGRLLKEQFVVPSHTLFHDGLSNHPHLVQVGERRTAFPAGDARLAGVGDFCESVLGNPQNLFPDIEHSVHAIVHIQSWILLQAKYSLMDFTCTKSAG